MGATITIENAVKRYGNDTIINGLSLEVKPGEFFTLLGPSGCGKTTLLRMIIGFNSIEGGTFKINDRVINDIPTNKRNIGMVFQNYAVFPHMNVFDNVAFGLRNRKLPKDEIERKVNSILKVVKIDHLKDRMPANLSGGQQQRVALARAIVIEPEVLLMDEPLSNLDAKLRVEMRNAIKRIQQQFGITTVYVTHDQEEALAVSDRIAALTGESTEEDVQAARAAYDALTGAQKALVTHLDTLTALEQRFAAAAAVAAVEELLAALPGADAVTLDDRPAIQAARAAYSVMTAEQQSQVSEALLEKLADAERVLNALLAVRGAYTITRA